jgi:hypothetical protein
MVDLLGIVVGTLNFVVSAKVMGHHHELAQASRRKFDFRRCGSFLGTPALFEELADGRDVDDLPVVDLHHDGSEIVGAVLVEELEHACGDAAYIVTSFGGTPYEVFGCRH